MNAEAAWDALLDAVERSLDTPGEPAAWAPVGAPIPASRADRARRLLTRQEERIRALRGELDEVRGHLAALDRVPARGDAAAYVDVAG